GGRCATLSGVVRSTVLRPLPAAVLLVVLTGCIKIDLALDINENEAIDGEIILALSHELAQLTGQAGSSSLHSSRPM
ncbi:MAG TPA: hypothetical protein VFI46_13280, partial [Jiangellaceae bacterium]|nr:hypothetical protein [Jiangellaceae bacterium]